MVVAVGVRRKEVCYSVIAVVAGGPGPAKGALARHNSGQTGAQQQGGRPTPESGWVGGRINNTDPEVTSQNINVTNDDSLDDEHCQRQPLALRPRNHGTTTTR